MAYGRVFLAQQHSTYQMAIDKKRNTLSSWRTCATSSRKIYFVIFYCTHKWRRSPRAAQKKNKKMKYSDVNMFMSWIFTLISGEIWNHIKSETWCNFHWVVVNCFVVLLFSLFHETHFRYSGVSLVCVCVCVYLYSK